MTALHVAPRPCTTCPYRKDTPSGIWHPDEYEKLRRYDDDYPPALEAFLCHQTNATGIDTACRGWLSVHPDHVAVRLLLLLTDRLTAAQRDADPETPLYSSGNEAADAGLVGVPAPSPEAQITIDKLLRTRVGRPE